MADSSGEKSGAQRAQSRNLFGGERVPEPGWTVWLFVKLFRLVVLTVLWTGVGMGAGLFAGIVVMMGASAFVHHTPDLTQAYRHGGFPAAIGAGAVAFLWNLMRTIQAASERAAKRLGRRE